MIYIKRIPNMTYCVINNNSYFIEDEYHAFFDCPLYDGDRLNYLPLHLYNSKSLHEFFNILSLSDSNVINQVSNFIFHIMKRRDRLNL